MSSCQVVQGDDCSSDLVAAGTAASPVATDDLLPSSNEVPRTETRYRVEFIATGIYTVCYKVANCPEWHAMSRKIRVIADPQQCQVFDTLSGATVADIERDQQVDPRHFCL